MRRQIRAAFLACLSSGSFLSTVDASSLPVLRIQPLGDSITKGSLSSHNNGYRGYLRDMLEGNSTSGVDMIGTLRDGNMRDNSHEGHSGKFLADIEEYYKLSIRARPNIVLIHAGTNNMDKEIDLERAPDLMESIIDGVHAAAPDAVVLVMPIIWANDTRMQNNTDRFNGALAGIIKSKVENGWHILSVSTNLTLADLADFKHPNDAGYEKMARAWLGSIVEANKRGWIKDPVPVNADELKGMGLGPEPLNIGSEESPGSKNEGPQPPSDKHTPTKDIPKPNGDDAANSPGKVSSASDVHRSLGVWFMCGWLATVVLGVVA